METIDEAEKDAEVHRNRELKWLTYFWMFGGAVLLIAEHVFNNHTGIAWWAMVAAALLGPLLIGMESDSRQLKFRAKETNSRLRAMELRIERIVTLMEKDRPL